MRRSASETLARKRERNAHMYDFWTGATHLYEIFLWLDRLPGTSYAVGQCNEPRPQDVSSCRPKIDRMQARQRSGNFIIYKHWKNHLVFHNVEHETGGSFLRKCSRCSTSSGGVLSLGRCLPCFMDVSVCVQNVYRYVQLCVSVCRCVSIDASVLCRQFVLPSIFLACITLNELCASRTNCRDCYLHNCETKLSASLSHCFSLFLTQSLCSSAWQQQALLQIIAQEKWIKQRKVSYCVAEEQWEERERAWERGSGRGELVEGEM